ncbi:GntR family transcriptional regulator [Actinopolymorpha rutila]|uniref:DNA-binding GntR family transcriptional regulator n=1 Tax=Actinopolymorpha rutila TaxID=446787 RepID=A0A852ZH78_9ACTN|nr:GntR family transcriptional regulator [Actinopolymorpha rutila]NYH91268.1 DNA-binding GntR family transcriptional regulator [Actinopolymorpha rutila]
MGDRTEDESESARVARVLREQIVDGVRVPGSRLVERDLAAELGISRVPVREALHTLAVEGLAVPRRNSWMTVRVFTDRDVDELNEVRLALEPLTVRRAAELRDPDALRRMKRCLDTQGRATARKDATTARRAAADFHEAMTEAGGNSLLAEISSSLAGRMRWLLGQYDDLQPVYDEHLELYLAIESGDAKAAAALARRHLRAAAARARKPTRRQP